MEEENRRKINHEFGNIVRGNIYLRRATSNYLTLITLENNIIKINLDLFRSEYHQKFISKDLDEYCKSFIEFLKKNIINFFLLNAIEFQTFHFVFICGGEIRFEKYVTISVVSY